MSSILQRVLKEHEQEVLAMGYDSIKDIGLHSIRKGAASYLASLPGGPPSAVICFRGGWTMGQIKDIYFHQIMQAGDEFMGRCVSQRRANRMSSSLWDVLKKNCRVRPRCSSNQYRAALVGRQVGLQGLQQQQQTRQTRWWLLHKGKPG
jgi:hypothetical protein